jgi:uncharacterized protein YdcH (DUF465 family)
MNEVDVKDYLIENDQEFRQLAQMHQSYETQLRELRGKSYLSDQEQVEETVLKKKKLALKDHMQILIHQHQGERSVH